MITIRIQILKLVDSSKPYDPYLIMKDNKFSYFTQVGRSQIGLYQFEDSFEIQKRGSLTTLEFELWDYWQKNTEPQGKGLIDLKTKNYDKVVVPIVTKQFNRIGELQIEVLQSDRTQSLNEMSNIAAQFQGYQLKIFDDNQNNIILKAVQFKGQSSTHSKVAKKN